MIRIEIFGNRAVEEDLFDLLNKHRAAPHFTLIPEVQGTGTSGPRKGDAVWPEENFVLVVYCEKKEADAIKNAVHELKERFPDEGVKLFAVKAEKI
ncbi:MAG TPA: hypothetical protein ENN69_08075 [Spirochaetia bacterium]|nr:hypothetical protein [Spirochaetia bacterium]